MEQCNSILPLALFPSVDLAGEHVPVWESSRVMCWCESVCQGVITASPVSGGRALSGTDTDHCSRVPGGPLWWCQHRQEKSGKCKQKTSAKNIRSRQDSNLRSQRESDFESDALTTRPRLLCVERLKKCLWWFRHFTFWCHWLGSLLSALCSLTQVWAALFKWLTFLD